ncbi:hypothetical protein KCU98_g6300, partial [Aureobasidium melanogenum]
MPGSHDLSVENLRLHERIVESEKHTAHVVETVTSAPTAKHSARPPAKPATVVHSKTGSKAGSKAGSKTGSKTGSKAECQRGDSGKASEHNKEVLVVTVIEEGDEEEEETLPPKAPSAGSKHNSEKKASSVKPPASKVSSHHSRHSRNWDIYHIPVGIPLPPGFSKMSEVAVMSNLDVKEPNEMALVKIPVRSSAKFITPAAAVSPSNLVVPKRYPTPSHTSSHHSKSSSHHSRIRALGSRGGSDGDGGGDGDFRDVVFEEVREVTKRRYVVKMPADKIGEWRV